MSRWIDRAVPINRMAARGVAYHKSSGPLDRLTEIEDLPPQRLEPAKLCPYCTRHIGESSFASHTLCCKHEKLAHEKRQRVTQKEKLCRVPLDDSAKGSSKTSRRKRGKRPPKPQLRKQDKSPSKPQLRKQDKSPSKSQLRKQDKSPSKTQLRKQGRASHKLHIKNKNNEVAMS